MHKSVILFVVCIQSLSFMSAMSVDDIITKTLVRYEDMQTFYAEFEQMMCDEVSGTCMSYTGKIYFMKPNFFRMEMEDPDQIYVGDSISLWIYLPEENHAIRQQLGDVPFQINPDHFLKNYKERFDAEMVEETETRYEIKLVPKRTTDIYDHIAIAINKKDFQIRSLTIVDKAGSENSFTFKTIKVNKNISKDKSRLVCLPILSLFQTIY